MKKPNDGPSTMAANVQDNGIDAQDLKPRGWLKHGNRPGDFHNCARCGAKTRMGTPCKSPAMSNGRCRMHGGKSTGPRTWKGRQKCAETHTVHGDYSKECLEQKRALRLASRANEIAMDLSIHRMNKMNEQLGFEIPPADEAVGVAMKLPPSTVEKKMARSQRILEKLWEIPSFRLLRSIRQRRRLRRHLRRNEHLTALVEESLAHSPAEAFERMKKDVLQRAQSGGALVLMAAQEAITALRSGTETIKPLAEPRTPACSSNDPLLRDAGLADSGTAQPEKASG